MNLDQALLLALEHQQAGRLPQAEALCQQILQQQPRHPPALHLLGSLARAAGRLDAAAELFTRTVRAAPASPEAHYDLGITHAMRGDLDAAIACFQKTLKLQPDNLLARYNLALAFYHRDRFEDADKELRRVIEHAPALPEAHLMLGLARHKRSRMEEAEACFKQAIQLRAGYADAYSNLANLYLDQGRLAEAEQACRAALEIAPDLAVAHYNLGLASFRLGKLDNAVSALQNALRIRPEHAEAWLILGNAQAGLNDPAQAIHSYRKAVTVKPDYAEAWFKLGNACLEQDRLEEALPACRRAVELRPDEYACTDLGHVFFRLRRFDDALSNYRRALAVKDLAPLHANIGLALSCLGRMGEAMQSYERSLALDPASAGAHSARLFTMHYLPDTTPTASLAAHRDFAARCEAPLKSLWRSHANTRDPERRLRIGYVSADFAWHSVAYFIEPVLAAHDHERFEIHCYHTSPVRDEVTERLITQVDHWHACAGLTDEPLAGRIRADGIDILVDLAGHTAGNRLLAFARKPAPLQVTYLGYPATTGLTAMDYRLCTLDTDPPGQEAWHSETLYRLPRTLWCYRPFGERPTVAFSPAARSGQITFGSLNNRPKISLATVACWADILRTLPAARLVMTNIPEGSAQHDLREALVARGVDPQRVTLHDRLPNEDYWRLLAEIDIALDPFPYTGTTTTCETLWMGIPVVTLAGETSVARSGLALLKSVGLEALVARDAADYVRIATGLARDTDRLDRLRREIPTRFDASPLRDEAAFTRDLETAYRDMWRRWCAREDRA